MVLADDEDEEEEPSCLFTKPRNPMLPSTSSIEGVAVGVGAGVEEILVCLLALTHGLRA